MAGAATDPSGPLLRTRDIVDSLFCCQVMSPPKRMPGSRKSEARNGSEDELPGRLIGAALALVPTGAIVNTVV